MVYRCSMCSSKNPLFLWISDTVDAFYCFRCTFRCNICGRFADVNYNINIDGKNVHPISRCNNHLDFDLEPGAIYKIIGRSATTDEKKVYMVMEDLV